MQDPLYREIILEHWNNPQNFGEIKDADFVVDDNNPSCGDLIHLTGKIRDGKLINIKFTGEGCAISRASASVFTEKIKGMEISDIKKITPDEVLEELGLQLTPARMKCALLVYQTIKATKPFRE
ncbi:MAG TPA: SUF system NifU family Fe-S cluster assembly protein [Patescibacteria group bacterium]|nr:SUF system NifU family Fe-S cluster assembly protein [Patescibacteria group bacterium]